MILTPLPPGSADLSSDLRLLSGMNEMRVDMGEIVFDG